MIRRLALATAFVVGFATQAAAQSGVIVPVLTSDRSGAVTTANVYQQIDAGWTGSNASRKGCLIVNTSANPESIRVGPTLVYPLAAGASFNCASPNNATIADQLSITSATAGSTYAAGIQ